MVLIGQNDCIRAKMVVFVQRWLYERKSGCIRTKVVPFWLNDCNWAKVVVFWQKLLCLGKVVVFGQKWFYSGKFVVFGQK